MVPRTSVHRRLRRVLAAAYFIAFAGTCVAQSGSLSLALNASPAPGSVSLSVVLKAVSEAQPAAMQWTLDYPASEVLAFTAAVGPAASAADKTVSCADNHCVLYGLQNANPVHSGVVAVLTIQFAASSASQVPFKITDALAASAVADPISLDTAGASISVVLQPFVFPSNVAATLPLTGSTAQLASSGGWETTVNLINVGSGIANTRLLLFSNSGSPLSMPLLLPQSTGPPTARFAASIDQTLARRAMLVVEAPGPDSEPQTGSAQVLTDGSVGGFVRFRYWPWGQEAAVPLETRNASAYFVAFDNTNGNATGVSVANLTAVPINIPVVIRDDSGAQIDSTNLSLPPNAQTAYQVAERFAGAANRTGTVEFDTPAGRRISVLGLRFPPSRGFTTIPVLTSGTSGNGSLAHLAFGGGWSTTIQLMNLGNTTAQAHLHFYDDSGADLAFPTDSTASATIDPVLLPGATLTIQSSSMDDAARTGSAYLTSDGSVTGFIRFRYVPLDQDAVVPLETRDAASYIQAFDNTGDLSTGLAVANLTSALVSVPILIRDENGVQLGSQSIAIPPHGHTAFVLASRFSETAGRRGTIEFNTPATGQISVLGLRFPLSGTFSMIPVIAP